jgi:hypothetical protein
LEEVFIQIGERESQEEIENTVAPRDPILKESPKKAELGDYSITRVFLTYLKMNMR